MYIEHDELVKRIDRTQKNKVSFTHEERVAIGTLAVLEGPAVAADITGVTRTRATDLSHGISSGSTHKIEPELKKDIAERVKSTVDNVKDQLLDGISKAIDEMSLNLPNTTKPQEAAATAKMLAETFEKISGKVIGNDGGGRVQILINAPAMRTEKDYEVISS